MRTGELDMRVHDLLLLSRPAAADLAEQANHRGVSWVAEALENHPWVVVRRLATGHPQEVAVGVRGAGREQRWAAVVSRKEVLGVISPEDLLSAELDYPDQPVFHALSWIRERGLAVTFGPGGSVGFELATGFPAVRDTSDLDLVVRAPGPLSDAIILGIDSAIDAVRHLAVVDVLIETCHGAVAFAELRRAVGMQPKPSMVLRSACGPRLVADPWDTP